MEHMAYNTKYYPSLIRKRQYWLMLQTISCQKPNIKDRETIKWKKGQITIQKPKIELHEPTTSRGDLRCSG